jgi:hypothetical protein
MAGCALPAPASQGETSSALSDDVLLYSGGPVIENARVVVVNWGEAVYAPVKDAIPGMYASVLDSPYLDWLAQYSTDTQTIGRGSLTGVVTITPGHTGATVTDGEIVDELRAQIGHALPAPDDDTIYAVYFPASVTVNFVNVGLSCVKFCAYHNALRVDSPTDLIAKFMVIPDQNCGLCLDGRSQVDATTVASTHELIETITDPQPTGQPAWRADQAHHFFEIADLCEVPQGNDFFQLSGTVNGYEVSDGWSNAQKACIHAPRTRHDFNLDGYGDALWHNVATGETIEWWMNGSTVTSRSVQAVPDTNFKIVGIGDFQGDGIADILWRNTVTGANVLWLMSGSTVAASFVLPTVDPSWSVAGVGDFQGDGKADIVWRNGTSGDNSIWLMDGPYVAAGATLPSVPDPSFHIVGVGDFQGDGKADLLWRNATTGANVLWFMGGLSVASSQLVQAVPDTHWAVAGVADFQHDGKADIFWRNTVTGDNSIWLMSGATVAASGTLPSVADVNWNVAQVADFDGDGMNDVIWRNGVTGSNSIWLMSGLQPKATASLPTIADTNWQAPVLR